MVSNDNFYVSLKLEKKDDLKVVFKQDIRRKKDNKLVIKAELIGVCTVKGKLTSIKEVEELNVLLD